ncbi:MAG: DUF4340 domain-containing protein [Saprospiraceae bacterium]
MRKSLILLVILALLGGIAYYLFTKNKQEEAVLVAVDRGFTISSMDDVRRIVIKHAKMPPSVFDKANGEWTLDYKYKVDPYIMAYIGQVLTGMELRNVPRKVATSPIIGSMKSNGIRVDVFTNTLEQTERTFFIGSDTQDGVGTYMLLDGDPQPYVMYLPGHNGGLRSRFEHRSEEYRDKYIYNIKPENIKSIKIQYPKNEISSFLLKNDNGISIEPLDVNQPPLEKPFNERFAKSYLKYFESIGSEGFANRLETKDSIMSKVPYAIVTITTNENNEIQHSYYSYDDFQFRTNKARRPEDVHTIERFFVKGKDDLYFTQTSVIGKIFIGYRQFFSS